MGKHVFWHETTISKRNLSGTGYLLGVLELLLVWLHLKLEASCRTASLKITSFE